MSLNEVFSGEASYPRHCSISQPTGSLSPGSFTAWHFRTSPLLPEGEEERIPNWAALIGLREQVGRDRVLYDVQPDIAANLREALPGGRR